MRPQRRSVLLLVRCVPSWPHIGLQSGSTPDAALQQDGQRCRKEKRRKRNVTHWGRPENFAGAEHCRCRAGCTTLVPNEKKRSKTTKSVSRDNYRLITPW